ncbi:MAG TPA: LysM peptidoglycan-binding domain-containing protein, partial [Spirochaetia bacterium]|nr:LysM peptidoglycan-binding domain-containing protein [Spirochaetia bacterium]
NRAEPFVGYIRSRIAYYHMPPEFLYLPAIESTYSPYAVSRSGAAGLWQFMVNSVDPYGLRINEWLDERFDFWKATDASLQKLQYNYSQLGDWLLALAAYNGGLNLVQRAVARSGAHDFFQLAASGYLPSETRHYVPKFLAIAAVSSYGGRYGLPLIWEEPMDWRRIPLDQAVDLRLLSRETGIDRELLMAGNAELRFGITPPGSSGYYLKVPGEVSKVVEQVLEKQQFRLMRFYVYSVTSGDTLYDLGKYYGVPVSMILQYNPGVDPRYLQIGKRLVIPGIKEVQPYRKAALTRPASAETRPLQPDGRFNEVYTVRPGDTLWSIAKERSTSAETIARANGVDPSDLLPIGLKLFVPGQGATVLQSSLSPGVE